MERRLDEKIEELREEVETWRAEKGLLVYYVGRSDDDVGGRLRDWVGETRAVMGYYKWKDVIRQ